MMFDSQPLVIGMGGIVGILIAMLILLIINLFAFYRLHATSTRTITDEAPAPLVSILVPARNEERCIEACVRSLLAQRYAPLEILVLDDQSSDATAQKVQSIIDALPYDQQGRLWLLRGETLPAG